ncbi:MAG: heavy metal-associated domain-containing protein, partial [Christensenellaceae bacterium]
MQKEISFSIKGMSCASCAAAVEQVLSNSAGVIYASVNLAAGSAFVVAEDKVDENTLVDAVNHLGYTAVIARDAQMITQDEHRFKKWEIILAFVCGMIVMYIGMSAHF